MHDFTDSRSEPFLGCHPAGRRFADGRTYGLVCGIGDV
jgi:hypothetical protein